MWANLFNMSLCFFQVLAYFIINLILITVIMIVTFLKHLRHSCDDRLCCIVTVTLKDVV